MLTAIEAGHFCDSAGGNVCRVDGLPMPCPAIKVARKRQAQYGRDLQRQVDMKVGRLDLPAPFRLT